MNVKARKQVMFGMAAVFAALAFFGAFMLGSAFAQDTTEPTIEESIDSAVGLVVSVSVAVSAAAGLIGTLIAIAKSKGLISKENEFANKIAHGAEYLGGTDEEVLARLNEIRAVVRGIVAFEPRLGEYLLKNKVDIDTLDKKADELTTEIESIHGLAKTTSPGT